MNKPYINTNEILNSFFSAQKFLDQFFLQKIKNVIFLSFLFFFFTIGLFFYFRFTFIGYSLTVSTIQYENILQTLYNIGIYYIFLILIISVYLFILKKIFQKTINILYLYLCQFVNFYRFNKFLQRESLVKNFVGSLRILFYRLGELSYKPNMYPLDINGDLDYICEDESSYELKNSLIIKINLFLLFLAKKNKFIKFIFLFVSFIFRIMFYNYENLMSILPTYLLLFFFINDILTKEISFFFIFSFFVFLLQIKKNYVEFLRKRNTMIDFMLVSYFYENDKDYKLQREYFHQNSDENIIIFTSKQNYKIESNLKEILDTINNNFERIILSEDIKSVNNFKNKTKRFCLIFLVLFFLIKYFYENGDHLKIILFNQIYLNKFIILSLIFSFVFLLFYLNNKIFYPKEYLENLDSLNHYRLHKKNRLIFWLLFFFLLNFLYILYKPYIFISDHEILYQNFFVSIEKTYLFEEKILYLFYKNEIYISFFSEEDQCYNRYLLRLIHFCSYKNELSVMSLKDIDIFIKMLISNHENHFFLQECLNIRYIQQIQEESEMNNSGLESFISFIFVFCFTLLSTNFIFYKIPTFILTKFMEYKSIHVINELFQTIPVNLIMHNIEKYYFYKSCIPALLKQYSALKIIFWP